MIDHPVHPKPQPSVAAYRRRRTSSTIAAMALFSLAVAGAMLHRSESRTNKVALASSPRDVSFVRTSAASYRPTRTYVGTLRPWIEANVGPQLVSAYVETVLVRPGTRVKHGEVLATLDCRNASTASSAIAMTARALQARQHALADEADRTQRLLDGGYASTNEVEQILAQSASEEAQLESQKALLAHSSLEVDDCILRAPFDGEIGDRFSDPGAFVRPGAPVVSVVDRSTVRFTADAPEADFRLLTPGTEVRIHVDAIERDVAGTIARRAPRADAEVRTIHFEVDVPNRDRSIPVDTTGEVAFEYGTPRVATELPLEAATVRGALASLFRIEDGVARAETVPVLGEIGGRLYVETKLPAGAAVVTEGRALIENGDRVDAREEAALTQPAAGSIAEGKAR